MGQSTIVREIWIDNVLTDPTTVLASSSDGTYGVRLASDETVVVADGTAWTQLSTGVYSLSFTDSGAGDTYEYVMEIVYDGKTHHIDGTIVGSTDGSDNLYALMSRIQPYVHGGCPEPVIKQCLRAAAVKFFKRSGIWEEDLDAIVSVADQDEYTLSTSYAATIRRVRWVTVDDIETGIKKVSSDGGTLTLLSPPFESDLDIVVSVTFFPKATCAEYPSSLLDKYDGGIIDGCIMELKLQADKPWYDANGAVARMEGFNAAVAEAKAERSDNRGPRNQMMSIPDFV